MSSIRDAQKRLEIIYKATAPEVKEQEAADAALDEFTRLKKKIHVDMKAIRESLKKRDESSKGQGTTTDSAEASYRIRVMIKAVKESITRMQEICDKEGRKKKVKDPEKAARIAAHKEILELVKGHLEEVENMERRKATDAFAADRSELLGKGSGDPSYLLNTKGNDGPIDPYGSELPDIDVETDLKEINARSKEIDKDVEGLGKGVQQLRDLAVGMGQELERQDQDIDRITKKVDDVTDHVDNINVTMKKTLEGVMKGDKFMVNCILLCVILALAAFISTQFLK